MGTGGGVPGVVLAILRGDLDVALCESVGKKARAVADIVARLGSAAPVHHARAEDVLAREHFQNAGDPRRGPLEETPGVVQADWGASIGC